MPDQKITKDSNILAVVQEHPETVKIMEKHGFHCVGCALARYETIEQGAQVHGIDADKLIEDLNKAISNK